MKFHSGDTPLTSAAGSPLKPKQAVERIQMLLAAGADKKFKNGDGKTALDVAKERKKKDIIPLLE
jgi:ankyrin repeat protein